jgi:N-sulfoglucosamine sulfohydrolase
MIYVTKILRYKRPIIAILCCYFTFVIQAQKPLNVLIIVNDDHGAQSGYFGTQGLKTPATDLLTKSGVAFTRAYCTFPSCSPSRAGLLTGTYPHVNGITRNVHEFFGATPTKEWFKNTAALNDQFHVKDSISSLVEVMKKAGYYTGISGKFHIAPHTKFPFDFWVKDFNNKSLDSFLNHANKKPFLFYHNIKPPHRPFLENDNDPRVAEKIKEEKMQVPPFLPNTPMMQKDWAEYLTAIEDADKRLNDLMATIKKLKLEDNLLIILVGDNGAPYHRGKYSPYNLGINCPFIISGKGINKNVLSKMPVSFADIMPTILDMTNMKIPASVNGKSLKPFITGKSEAPINDFVISEVAFPTPIESNYQARSMVTDRFLYIRSNGRPRSKLNPDDMYMQKGWKNFSYTATMNAKLEYPLAYQLLQTLENTPPVEELFDLHADPWCMHDISKNPDYKTALEKLQKKLDTWIVETKDTEMMVK